MGIPYPQRLNFKKPVITRGGNKVRFYHIYQDEIHGAYEGEVEDKWYICRWNLNGYFAEADEHGRQHITTLDLINAEEEEAVLPAGAA